MVCYLGKIDIFLLSIYSQTSNLRKKNKLFDVIWGKLAP